MDQASGRIKLDIVRYYEAVAEWALPHLQARPLALVRAPDGMLPQRFSSVLGPKNRVGEIFIDDLRNGRSASTVASFSVRARPGMAVSMPISWEELTDVKSRDQWTMAQAIHRHARLQRTHGAATAARGKASLPRCAARSARSARQPALRASQARLRRVTHAPRCPSVHRACASASPRI
ncbi:non-homologous end-joining DNA ligase LigD [Caballeronia cordobensis]|uniref:non-homologous end-joining DNA ligase LigD n=1 Tax=Caballeronia cordobensis TaxID=1353886 RepID=UPI003908AEB8